MLASHYVMIYQLMGFKIILDYITLPFNKNINHVAPHFLNNYADCEQTLETKTYGVHTSRFRRKIPLCSAIDRTRSCCLWWACWASCVYWRNRIFPWSCMVLTSHSEPGIMSAIHFFVKDAALNPVSSPTQKTRGHQSVLFLSGKWWTSWQTGCYTIIQHNKELWNV